MVTLHEHPTDVSADDTAPASIGPSAASCSVTWRRRSAKSRALVRTVSFPAKRRPCWSRRPVRPPPKGRARWTLELLAGELVRLTEHDDISRETVRRRLAENELKPWRKDMWCIPQVDGEFVARMEDVLDLYAEAPDPKRPVVCFDESPTQLIGEITRRRSRPSRVSLSATTACISATGPPTCSSSSTCTAPGARSKSPTAAPQSTSPPACGTDDVHFPRAERIRVVLDNLSTHSVGALYQAFPPERTPTPATPAGVPFCPKAHQLVEHGRNGDCRVAQPVPGSRIDSQQAPRIRKSPRGSDSAIFRRPRLDVHTREGPRQKWAGLPKALNQRVKITVTRY